MVRRLILRAGALAAAVLLVISAGAGAQAQQLKTIRFIAAPGDDMLGFYYAVSSGMFTKAGLNVVAEKAASGAAVTTAMVGGAADVGRTSLNSLIAAHAHGVPVVLIAPAAVHEKNKSVNDGVLVNIDSPLKSPLDLQGKIISSTEIGSIGALGVRAMVDAAGGDSTKVKFVELPTPAIAAALAANRIDAGVSNEPFLSRDLAGGKTRVLFDMLEGYPGVTLEGAYFTMRDWATANPDAVQTFVRVLSQANKYANTHITELMPLLIANTGIEPDAAAKMAHARLGDDLNPSQVQPVIDICAKYKTIPARFDAREMLLPARK